MLASAARRESMDVSPGNGAAASTGAALRGTYTDAYTLGPRIGRGGLGDVYQAAHARLPAQFAIKILRRDLLTNRDAVAQFCRQAEIMCELRHPHIVQILDFNTSLDGVPYLVMEHLEGVDLETRIAAEGRLSLDAVVRIVEAVASALSAAHARSIVHGDLSPAKIFLVQSDDFVKVLDFGTSRASCPEPLRSRFSRLVMAPEQARGFERQLDGRTDQFALAAITYLMLTGREAFVGDDYASLMQEVVYEEPTSLSQFLPGDTTVLQAVLDRALAKRQEDRFDDIADFAKALGAVRDAALRQGGRAAPTTPSLETAPLRAS